MWLQTNSPKRYLHVARLTSSPLWYGRTPAGSVVLASTESILKDACKAAGLELASATQLDEGVYIRFENSDVTRTLDIPELRKPRFTFGSTPARRVATTPRTSTTLGTGIGGDFRDGRWHTGLELMLQQWEEEGREDN